MAQEVLSLLLLARPPTVAAVTYDTDAQALFDRFTTPANAARKGHINTCIAALKTAGVWAKTDCLYLIAAHDAQAAQRNWIADAYNLSPVNDPTFLTDRHYVGDGVSQYLDTGFNPTTAAGMFTQNDAHMAAYTRNSVASSNIGGHTNCALMTSATAGRTTCRPSNTTTVSVGDSAMPGHSCWTRSASNVWEGYVNGVDTGGGVNASAAPSNANFTILSRSAAGPFGTLQVAHYCWGGNLTADEELARKNAIHTYLVAVGAA